MVANVVESKVVELAGEMLSQIDDRAGETPTLRLPPSERDFEVYGLVVNEGISTRAAARAFGLSQTRVIQIRDRVAEWMASEVPPLARATPAQRLALGANIARNRFDFLYSQAMDSWRESKGPKAVMRTGLNGETTSTRESYGDPRYIMLAARIVERTVGLGAKIEKAAVVGQESGGGDRESGSELSVQGSGFSGEGSGFRVQEENNGQETENYPVGDCSLAATTEEMQTQVEEKAVVVSAVAPIISNENKQRRQVFFGGPDGVVETCSASPGKPIPTTDQSSKRAALSSGGG